MVLRYFSLVLFIGLLLSSCSSDKKNKTNEIWDNTQKINLGGSPINLKIPNSYKQTSRFKIPEDLANKSKLKYEIEILNKLYKSFNFDESTVDYFVDTSSTFKVLTFVNIKKVMYKKEIEAQFNNLVSNNYTYIADRTKNLTVEKIDTKSISTDKIKMLKFKHKFINKSKKNPLYSTVYYITTPVQTVFVYETSITDDEVGDYLWSIKDI